MLSASTISLIGALLGLASTTYGIVYAIAKRSYWGEFFREQSALVRDFRKEKQRSADLQERSEAAESLNATLRPIVEELRKELESLKIKFIENENAKMRVDAMVDWMDQMISYAQHLEQLLKEAGLSTNAPMPTVPDIMKTRFGVPETL